MNSGSGALTELTLEQCRRIDQTIVMEVSFAVENENWAFIDRIGMDHDAARLIHGMSNGTTSAMVRAVRGGIFALSSDNQRLTKLLTVIDQSTARTRQCRELVAHGATHRMCNELGFPATRSELLQIRRELGKDSRGKPPTLTDAQVRACLAYWRAIVHPERYDPIDLLIRTCDDVGVAAVSIWEFAGPQSKGFMTDIRQYGYGTPAHERPWVRVMFPRWKAP